MGSQAVQVSTSYCRGQIYKKEGGIGAFSLFGANSPELFLDLLLGRSLDWRSLCEHQALFWEHLPIESLGSRLKMIWQGCYGSISQPYLFHQVLHCRKILTLLSPSATLYPFQDSSTSCFELQLRCMMTFEGLHTCCQSLSRCMHFLEYSFALFSASANSSAVRCCFTLGAGSKTCGRPYSA